VKNPDLAGDPNVASNLLALFLADKELAIKKALLAGNMASARELVNGGTNGLDRFEDAYQRGSTLIPNSLGT
jgi:putative chitinase